jgi:hypothetical protein
VDFEKKKTHQAWKRQATQTQALASNGILQGWREVWSRIHQPHEGRQICRAAAEVARSQDGASASSQLNATNRAAVHGMRLSVPYLCFAWLCVVAHIHALVVMLSVQGGHVKVFVFRAAVV